MLVGGKGTRMRPLTLTEAKPMLPTAGVPFLAHQIARAHHAGVERIVLATSYRAETFRSYFGDGSAWGVELDYITETDPLGTGGGIRNVADRLGSGPDDPVLIFNGDVLSGHDIAAQLALHRQRDAEVTLHLTEVADPSAFGCVSVDADARVLAFVEKSPRPVSNLINAGCYVFRRRVIDEIPAGRPVSVERETFPDLLAAGAKVVGFADSAYWLDLGTPDAFVRGSCDLVRGVVGSPALPGPTGESLVLGDASVSTTVTLTGGSCVGPGARIGDDTVIEGSVVFGGAVIGAGVSVRASVVGAGARLGAGVVLDRAVIGDRAEVGEGNELRAGARLWPGVVLPPVSLRFSSDE